MRLGKPLPPFRRILTSVAYAKGDCSKQYAIKTVSKETVGNAILLLKREVEALKACDHPNIVKLYDSHETSKNFNLVMEHCRGGDLQERVINKDRLPEPQAAYLVY